MSLNRDAFRVQRDGMHDVVQTPEFQDALDQAISNYFGAHAPGLLELLRRFLSPGARNDSRSYSVGTSAGGPSVSGDSGRVQVLEHDPSRVEAIIFNFGTVTVFIGGRQVTTGGPNDPSGGVPISPGTGLILSKNIGELYAVSGSAAQDVRVLDVSGV